MFISGAACVYAAGSNDRANNLDSRIHNAIDDCESRNNSNWELVMVSDEGAVTPVTNREQVNDKNNNLAIALNLYGHISYLSLNREITLNDLLSMDERLSSLSNDNGNFVIYSVETNEIIFSGLTTDGFVVEIYTDYGMAEELSKYCSGLNLLQGDNVNSADVSCSIG